VTKFVRFCALAFDIFRNSGDGFAATWNMASESYLSVHAEILGIPQQEKIMNRFANWLSTVALLAVVVALCASGAYAAQRPAVGPYLVTNDDVFNSTTPSNTATVYKIGGGGSLTLVTTISTGGGGSGGGLFAAARVNVLHSKTQACTFVGDSNPSVTTTNNAPDVAGINLATLKRSGTFPGSATNDSGQNGGVGLADAGNYIIASFTGNAFSSPAVPGSLATYRILSGCKLKYVGSIPATGTTGSGYANGSKVTPNGKTLIVAFVDGSIGSYSISATGKLKLVSQETSSAGAFPEGVDVTADGKWAIFGDASGIPEADVAPIKAGGVLGPTVNYKYLDQGANSNNVLLSPDESVLYVSNNSTGSIGAVPFNKATGVLDPTKSCSSGVLKNFDGTWFDLGGLAFSSTTGKGGVIYAAELGFPSGIAAVKYSKVKGEDEPCDLNEQSSSPVADPASNGLLSIGAYPPRPF
jgi:hypothetical protein